MTLRGSAPTAFVTGATGFLGLNLIAELSLRGWDITALHRVGSDLTYLSRFPVRPVVGAVEDLASIEAAMPPRVDVVFHLAGDVSLWSRNNARQMQTNVQGTRHVVEAALRGGAKRFVHTSSSIVYGLRGSQFDETTRCDERDSWFGYLRSKILAEDEVRAGVSRGLNAVLLNPAHVIGRYDRNNWARLFRLTIQGKLLVVPPGRGSFAHGAEVARAHVAAASAGRTGENYLLGGADASYRELAGIIAELTGRAVKPRPIPGPLLRVAAKTLDWISVCSRAEPIVTSEAAALLSADTSCRSDKAIRDLGYRPVPLRDMLEDCYRWITEEGLLQVWRRSGRPSRP
jgi:nucleoside-diphosphate-sugar epimerase